MYRISTRGGPPSIPFNNHHHHNNYSQGDYHKTLLIVLLTCVLTGIMSAIQAAHGVSSATSTSKQQQQQQQQHEVRGLKIRIPDINGTVNESIWRKLFFMKPSKSKTQNENDNPFQFNSIWNSIYRQGLDMFGGLISFGGGGGSSSDRIPRIQYSIYNIQLSNLSFQLLNTGFEKKDHNMVFSDSSAAGCVNLNYRMSANISFSYHVSLSTRLEVQEDNDDASNNQKSSSKSSPQQQSTGLMKRWFKNTFQKALKRLKTDTKPIIPLSQQPEKTKALKKTTKVGLATTTTTTTTTLFEDFGHTSQYLELQGHFLIKFIDPPFLLFNITLGSLNVTSFDIHDLYSHQLLQNFKERQQAYSWLWSSLWQHVLKPLLNRQVSHVISYRLHSFLPIFNLSTNGLIYFTVSWILVSLVHYHR